GARLGAQGGVEGVSPPSWRKPDRASTSRARGAGQRRLAGVAETVAVVQTFSTRLTTRTRPPEVVASTDTLEQTNHVEELHSPNDRHRQMRTRISFLRVAHALLRHHGHHTLSSGRIQRRHVPCASSFSCSAVWSSCSCAPPWCTRRRHLRSLPAAPSRRSRWKHACGAGRRPRSKSKKAIVSCSTSPPRMSSTASAFQRSTSTSSCRRERRLTSSSLRNRK